MKIKVTCLTPNDGPTSYIIEGYLCDSSSGLADFVLAKGIFDEDGDGSWKGYGSIETSKPGRCMKFSELIQLCYSEMEDIIQTQATSNYVVTIP